LCWAITPAAMRLDEGDVLVLTRLDRLARSTRDLLNILDTVAKAGAGFRSLADAWADTTAPHGRLTLTVLGGLAEFERELIRARTGEVASVRWPVASSLAGHPSSMLTSVRKQSRGCVTVRHRPISHGPMGWMLRQLAAWIARPRIDVYRRDSTVHRVSKCMGLF
jgi:hypothetical protein